jgi:lycopene cyclase domain-containing protein
VTYWFVNIGFLAIVGLVVVAAVFVGRAPRWRIVGLSAIPLLVLTVVFDNVLVGVGIVAYDPSRISGVLVGVAPLEDFSYAIAAVVLLPCLWTLLTPRPDRAEPAVESEPAP